MDRAERRAFLTQVLRAHVGDVPAIVDQALAFQMTVFLPLGAVCADLWRFLDPGMVVRLKLQGAAREGSKGLGEIVYTLHEMGPGHHLLHTFADVLHP